MKSNNKVTLTLTNGNKITLETKVGTMGDEVITIAPLAKTGIYTFDPGFKATAACASNITYIDGGQGLLLHRGYPIDQLAQLKDFSDISYLLIHGELPNQNEKEDFIELVKQYQVLEDHVQVFLDGFKQDAHPMAMVTGIVAALSAYHPVDLNVPEQRYQAAVQLIAKIPSVIAMCYRHATSKAFVEPDNDLDYAGNFLQMMFGPNKNEPVINQAMDQIFTLHADHEQNASTSTVRLAGSTGTHPFAAIAAGMSALWGPAHGGANEACLSMLQEIGDERHISQYIERAKDPDDPFRLMGFGHRVYKSYDPRATLMRTTCHNVLEAVGSGNEPLFKLAMKLEKIALEDDYFIEKNLYPNIDFYSGITLNAIGIPTNMFTTIFALARTSGWVAHWLEMTSEGYQLGRPRQLYTGPAQREVPA